MNIFKKAVKEAEKLDEAIKEVYDNTPEAQPIEEWVWVEGFKGTDKNMCCRDFQYELGKQYDMPDDQTIKACESGFHLCLEFEDVFNYYNICLGNRFFKVRALVRKTDRDSYGHSIVDFCRGYTHHGRCDKIAAKSIIFLSELTIDEICKPTTLCDLPYEYKQMAIEIGVENTIMNYQISTLVEDGYSLPFASYMVERNRFNIAHIFGSQKDLSMDMKVLCILKEIN
jgi:hypothetical protein